MNSMKQSQSSKTRSSKSQSTNTQRKKDILPLAEVKKTENLSPPIATGKKGKTKLSESSRPENLQKRNTRPFQKYDYDNLPELNQEQIESFATVSKENHKKFAKIDTIQILKDGVAIKTKKVGRPKKKADEKGTEKERTGDYRRPGTSRYQ